MKTHLLAGVAVAAWAGCGTASAADFAAPASVYPIPYWTGFYAGLNAGAALGRYDPTTSATAGGHLDAADAAAVTAAGRQSIKPLGFGTGIEGGYNWQSGNLLFGVEADLDALHLNGATNSGGVTYPGVPAGKFTITSNGNADWLFTARPRVGFVAPNHWLLYATGGLALTQLQADFSFIDTPGAEESGRLNAVKAGYAAGAGVEAPLTAQLSVKAEYLHIGFGDTSGSLTSNNVAQVFAHGSGLNADILRAGLDYRFGGADAPAGGDPVMALTMPFWPQTIFSNWQVETGTRVWFSSGYDGEGPLFNSPPLTLASRLIYGNLDAVSGETFARVDHVSGVFVKGYLGAGGLTSGHLNDEDFPADKVYSNTVSSSQGHIGYATIDLGYDFLRTPGGKVGAFVGYNYYNEAINNYGCRQLAGDDTCVPALPSNLLILTENDQFNSLRLGLSSEVMLSDRLRLTTDAAYVPWVNYIGLDDHLLRQLLGPDAANGGSGVMLEAVVDYWLTPAWSVGVGGRYWAWNLNTGTAGFEDLTTGAPTTYSPSRYSAERYGMFVQSSYRFGDPVAPPDGAPIPTKAPMLAWGPVDWTSLYLGGQLGGGFSDARWSDPFASTVGAGGLINVAGFGDRTHATGPLGGGQVGADWQTGALVLGAQADADAANMRGENTCFSGLGGVNCQHVVNAVGTVTGRLGYAFNRSLAYVKGGGAFAETSYNVLGDTGVLTLGRGSTTLTSWGWTAGIGLEYALTNHWSTFAEYDHIGLPSTVVPFPTVATLNAQTIRITQTADLFKLGLNYRFDPFPLLAVAARN